MKKNNISTHSSKSSSGLSHYIAQRITALVLIPVSIWFVIFIFRLSCATSLSSLGELLMSPFNVVSAIVFIIAFLYHGLLGMKEIITDYIHTDGLKKTINTVLFLATTLSAVVGIFSLVYFYIILRVFFPC